MTRDVKFMLILHILIMGSSVMRVALTSDTHGYTVTIPPGIDAVLHAGDIGPDVRATEWFRDTFYPWAARAGVPIFATFGNHDFIGERGRANLIGEHEQLPPGAPGNLRLVVDEQCDVLGVPVWFSPWSVRFFDWAFMADEGKLKEKYLCIAADTQVIVTHGPPHGYGDLTIDRVRAGSAALTARMKELTALRVVVTGHIHEAFGVYDAHGVLVYNVSMVDIGYRPCHEAVIIEWPPESY